MQKLHYFCFLFLFFLISCAKYSNSDIKGNWEAAEVLEEGQPLDIDNSEVKFHFSEDGYYNFQSTLNYEESGTFEIKKELLFTKDTLNTNSEEKAVRIDLLNADSLYLEMNDDGKKRLVKLFKND